MKHNGREVVACFDPDLCLVVKSLKAKLARAEKDKERVRDVLKASCLWPACETTCSVLTRSKRCMVRDALTDEG